MIILTDGHHDDLPLLQGIIDMQPEPIQGLPAVPDLWGTGVFDPVLRVDVEGILADDITSSSETSD